MGIRIPEGIWKVKRQDNKSTSTCSSKERRKFLSGNRHFKTCYRKSFIPRTGRKIEIYHIFIQDNATSGKKLWDLWQRTTCYSRSLNKVETIFIGCYWEIWSLNRLWKSQVFLRISQVEWMTSKMVSKVTELWLYIMTYSRKNKY